jgi:predicted DNA-binding protein
MAAFFREVISNFSNEVEKYNIACNLLKEKKKKVNYIIHVIMIPVGIG